MLIKQFIDEYCQDIVAKSNKIKEVLDELDFTYDDIVTSNDGETIKVIYADDTTEIAVHDILTLGDTDFRRIYKSTAAYNAYKAYLSNFIILEGEEVLNQIRNEIKRSREQVERYASLDIESMISAFDA